MGETNSEATITSNVDVERTVHRFQAGDPDAGHDLAEMINSIIRKRLRRLSGSEDEREEIAQECAVSVIQRIAEYNPVLGSFEGWVSGFAHNCWRSHVRNAMRTRQATVAMESVVNTQYEIEDGVGQRDNLQVALESLDLLDRELLHMRYSLGMTSDEIAAGSDMNAPQIRKRISRAMERLRRHPAAQQLLMSIGVL
jgi:RNA polymerase sigma factor (sigma-70 family)